MTVSPKKKVLLVIIDALNSHTFFPAVESGKLPTFQKLLKIGTSSRKSISIFPSLTPAATSTIVTGDAPQDHRVFGFHWYDRSADEIAYYGDDFWTVAKLGFAKFIHNCLWSLNQDRLSSKTIFSKVQEAGLEAACLNFLIYQGDTEHEAKVPLWFSWHPQVPSTQVLRGPQTLFFGDFVSDSETLDEEPPERKSGIFGRMGFNDDNTASLLLALAKSAEFPDFTLAYFPDHDYECHSEGPEAGISVVEEIDSVLASFIEEYGGLEKLLSEVTLVVTGDHSQSEILDDGKEATIEADDFLSEFNFTNAQEWQDEETLKLFPDMRCAQVYFRRPNYALEKKVIAAALAEPRIDQVMWKENGNFWVKSAERGSLEFWPCAEGEGKAIDQFGAEWDWSGDLSVLDGVVEEGEIRFGDYPNAFERIVGAMDHPDSGDLWLTSKLGYEFANRESEVHVGGGSHGSLRREDSTSPLIVAGTDIKIPESTRLTDVEPLCLALMGLGDLPKVFRAPAHTR